MPPELHAALGRSFVLTCTIDANPQSSSVQWIRPDGRTSDGATLRLDVVTIHDAGNYSCLAKNEDSLLEGLGGGISRRVVTLFVDRTPGASTAHAPLTPVVRGATARMTCQSQDLGSPPARYK